MSKAIYYQPNSKICPFRFIVAGLPICSTDYVPFNWENLTMKHTKGEWYINQDMICTNDKVIATLPNQGLSPVHNDDGQIIDQEIIINKANAHLIAAAPDLLAGNKIGLSYINAQLSGVPRPLNDILLDKEQLEQAIAKAEH